MHVKILILGGGLAGMSTAYHLEQAGITDYLVLEKESDPGGLCRSIYQNGFTFDYAGHLLHLHTAYGKKLVRTLLKDNLQRLPRRAWIYTGAARVPFPFQANLYALPPRLRQNCLDGLRQIKRAYKTPPAHFEQWCLRMFGSGIYQAFMQPYNTKLWGRPPHKLTCEWCGPFVPAPSVSLLRQSAVKKTTQKLGYNASFYYPKQGGCGALVRALAAHITRLKTNTPVTRLDLRRRTAHAGGKEITFDYAVNTLPLPQLLGLLAQETSLSRLAGQLVNQPVTVYQVAFKGKVKPFSWIYCPDEQDPFYRVGLQSSFSTHNAPAGCYSLYVELPGTVRPGVRKEQQIRHALLQKGIISEHDEKLFSFWQRLPYAYVVYDKHRTPVVRRVLRQLEKHHCYCAGRYGLWEYSFMERALLQGKHLAEKLYNEVV